MSQEEPGRTFYTLAKDFHLQASADQGVTPALIGKYLHLSTPRRDSLVGLYGRILTSVQNANMKAPAHLARRLADAGSLVPDVH